MTYGGIGSRALTAELIDSEIKGHAERSFVLRNLVTKTAFRSDRVSYFRETANILSAPTDIAPGTEFPIGNPGWEKNTAYMKQLGLQLEVLHNDELTNQIAVWAAVTRKLGEAVAAAVDQVIYKAFNAAGTQSAARTAFWDGSVRANRHPIDDIASGVDNLSRYGYRADTVILHPYEARVLGLNDDFKSTVTPQLAMIQQGEETGMIWIPGIGKKLNIVVSQFAVTDQAIIAAAKRAVTWNTLEPLTTYMHEEPGIKKIVRAWENGSAYLTDPYAVFKVTDVKE